MHSLETLETPETPTTPEIPETRVPADRPRTPGEAHEADWMDTLHAQQRAAVLHDGSHLRILAGAGSGKTRTLASRVARLLVDGVPAERVLLLTFTRRAAADMLGRVRDLVGEDLHGDASRMRGRVIGGTFHAVANGILRRHGAAVGIAPSATMLDPGDVADLIGTIRSELELDQSGVRFPKRDTLADIASRVANAQQPLSEVLASRFPWCTRHEDDVRRVLQGYHRRKRELGVVDYDDLLLLWRALLRHPTVGATVAGAFDHVLVDEYQDTNAVQEDILRGYAEAGATITAVGDDAQAIYGFRAASVEHIRRFEASFPGATTLPLTVNYRSTPQILASANAVLASMRDSVLADGDAEPLLATRAPGTIPVLLTCDDEDAQSRAICDAVLDARERGVRLTEQAVLFRTGHHSDGLEIALARADIPYVKFGGLKFLERAHVKDVRALLRMLDNDRDLLAWDRILRRLPGVGPAHARRAIGVLTQATAVGRSALAAFVADEVDLPEAALEAASLLRDGLVAARGPDGEEPPPSVQIGALTPFCRRIWKAIHPDADARLADLEQVRMLAMRETTRSTFLASLTLDPPASTSDLAGPPHLDDDYLILSTLHSAKGGEWRVVHLMHAADGNIPSDMALSSRDEVEEERRLFYVGVTRARDELRISVPLRFHHDRRGHRDAHTWAQRSRFLDPIAHTLDEQVTAALDDTAAVDLGSGADPTTGTVVVDAWLDGLLAG